MTTRSVTFESLIGDIVNQIDQRIERMIDNRKLMHIGARSLINRDINERFETAEAAASCMFALSEEFPDDDTLNSDNWREILGTLRKSADAYQRLGYDTAAAGVNLVRRAVAQFGESLENQ